jgi:hypothetical protein
MNAISSFVLTVLRLHAFYILYQSFVLGVKLSSKSSKNKVQKLVTVSTVSTKVKMAVSSNNNNK